METILKEFAHLNKIPRPSGHEQAVAAYLKERGQGLGFAAEIDEHLNVIYEVPATPGYEGAPLVILQAHTDMVCVGGGDYDPLNDPIITRREGNTLKAVGTSLGADDGIGVALILAILSQGSPHGPLRVIFTADEEAGMTGAAALEDKYLDGDYLINLDWEDLTSLCIGCAGFLTMEYGKKAVKTQVSSKIFTLAFQGFKGGHSGTEIWENRGNAIKLAADYCQALIDEGIDLQLLAIEGGRAVNVIPYSATVTMAISPKDENTALNLFNKWKKSVEENYPEERNMELALGISEQVDTPSLGYSPEDSKALIGFLHSCPHGVKEMSSIAPDMVSLSNNLALVKSGEDIIVTISYRSDVDSKMAAFRDETNILAKKYGFSPVDLGMSPAWTPRDGSPLQEMAINAYKEVTAREPRLESVHAGLECSYFACKNPNLDMVSLGPTILWCHSVEEILYLDTLIPTREWLQRILDRLGCR